uniref:Uncharacterized protein n=1 Tax=Angiostrongylus cantonensis TaxID=6313 RepID=A0A0K0D9B2_ANGCA
MLEKEASRKVEETLFQECFSFRFCYVHDSVLGSSASYPQSFRKDMLLLFIMLVLALTAKMVTRAQKSRFPANKESSTLLDIQMTIEISLINATQSRYESDF